MSGKLKVHFGTLSDAAEELDSVAKALKEHLTHVDDAVRRLAETWEGEAQESFDTYYRRWSAVSHDLQHSLRVLHKTMHTAHENYSIARAANLRMWGRR